MKEYAIEQRRFNEKVFGRGTRSIDSVEGLLNKYAKEGWVPAHEHLGTTQWLHGHGGGVWRGTGDLRPLPRPEPLPR
ncbi:MAG: hypothetical protein IKF09_07970 [Clostridiales bacterium]|nr:hypothetical protein [Clostridiales bacterium]